MDSNHPEYHYLVNQIPGLTEEQKAAFYRKAKANFQRVSDRLAMVVIADVEGNGDEGEREPEAVTEAA